MPGTFTRSTPKILQLALACLILISLDSGAGGWGHGVLGSPTKTWLQHPKKRVSFPTRATPPVTSQMKP